MYVGELCRLLDIMNIEQGLPTSVQCDEVNGFTGVPQVQQCYGDKLQKGADYNYQNGKLTILIIVQTITYKVIILEYII